MRKFFHILCGLLSVPCALTMGAVGYYSNCLPDTFCVQEGKQLTLTEQITASESLSESVAVDGRNVGVQGTYMTTLNLFGVVPIKKAAVRVVPTQTVVVGGIPFGIKLYTDGVLIVSFSDVDGKSGTFSPAKKAGLRVGDRILSINGTSVYTNEEVGELVENSAGKPLNFYICRDGVSSSFTIVPARSKSEGVYKVGLWVRDSSAGIGTVTFYDPESNVLAGLGHPVCDVDTGKRMEISGGEVVPARIYGVTKSVSGEPGELRGGFDLGTYGKLIRNDPLGIYAVMTRTGIIGQTLEVAHKQDVCRGPATMLTTVSGTTPKAYTVNIKRISYASGNGAHNMVVEVTDKDLLSIAGGITQGMSGSPVLQNGRLIGAITHVLVDDPTTGYAIFAENMLETAQSVANENKLKDAS